MTEEELQSNEIWEMLKEYKAYDSERKSRLFTALCCRQIWDLIPVLEARLCIVASEQYADDITLKDHLNDVVESSMRACEAEFRRRTHAGELWGPIDRLWKEAISRVHRFHPASRFHVLPAVKDVLRQVWERDQLASGKKGEIYQGDKEQHALQVSLIREIFGNPFRPVSVDPSWLTESVVGLANGIYSDRAFERMPILADALQDAGCTNDDILNHCREPGNHVRGCWVVDLLLGKE